MTAPDLDRLTRELAVRKRLQQGLLVFSRAVSARTPLPAALESLAGEVTAIFGTRRTSIWLYDRRAQRLTLAASSDPREQPGTTIQSEDDSPLARALRGDGPEVIGGQDQGAALVAPLRAWRRVLGTLAIDGRPRAVPDDLFVELAGDLSRQLSVAVENVLVLEEIIRRHGDFEQMRAQLAQAQKLASLGQFVAYVAHEMKNPLQGVLGHTELLMTALERDSPHRAALQRIYTDGERAAKMIQDLLVFGGRPRVSKKPVDLSQLISETVAIREATPHRPSVDYVVRVPTDLPRVMGDPALLQQALLNIFVNAEHAIAEQNGSGEIVVNARADAGLLVLELDDSGPGIPSDLLPHLFDPFFTTKEVGKGTGLGLAITFGIVHEHGGSIAAGTSPMGGARFTIRLPAAR
jgi:signal transduction histidine kinase